MSDGRDGDCDDDDGGGDDHDEDDDDGDGCLQVLCGTVPNVSPLSNLQFKIVCILWCTLSNLQ